MTEIYEHEHDENYSDVTESDVEKAHEVVEAVQKFENELIAQAEALIKKHGLESESKKNKGKEWKQFVAMLKQEVGELFYEEWRALKLRQEEYGQTQPTMLEEHGTY